GQLRAEGMGSAVRLGRMTAMGLQAAGQEVLKLGTLCVFRFIYSYRNATIGSRFALDKRLLEEPAPSSYRTENYELRTVNCFIHTAKLQLGPDWQLSMPDKCRRGGRWRRRRRS